MKYKIEYAYYAILQRLRVRSTEDIRLARQAYYRKISGPKKNSITKWHHEHLHGSSNEHPCKK